MYCKKYKFTELFTKSKFFNPNLQNPKNLLQKQIKFWYHLEKSIKVEKIRLQKHFKLYTNYKKGKTGYLLFAKKINKSELFTRKNSKLSQVQINCILFVYTIIKSFFCFQRVDNVFQVSKTFLHTRSLDIMYM